MPDVTIYTTPFCPYCHMAKGLLKKKNVTFTEIDVSDSATSAPPCATVQAGVHSVPQIFIGSVPCGRL